jgi:hypothetical protein
MESRTGYNRLVALLKFQQTYQMRHRNFRAARTFGRVVASAVYEPVGSAPSPPHSLSGGMIALNHPYRVCPIESALPLTLSGSPSPDRRHALKGQEQRLFLLATSSVAISATRRWLQN